MRRTNHQLKLIDDVPAQLVMSTKLTDTCGNPSESYNWRQMDAVRREWQQEYGRPYANMFELTIPEIVSTEMHVRRELYP